MCRAGLTNAAPAPRGSGNARLQAGVQPGSQAGRGGRRGAGGRETSRKALESSGPGCEAEVRVPHSSGENAEAEPGKGTRSQPLGRNGCLTSSQWLCIPLPAFCLSGAPYEASADRSSNCLWNQIQRQLAGRWALLFKQPSPGAREGVPAGRWPRQLRSPPQAVARSPVTRRWGGHPHRCGRTGDNAGSLGPQGRRLFSLIHPLKWSKSGGQVKPTVTT